MNSAVRVTHYPISFDELSGASLVTAVDAVVDGTDNHATRLLIDRFTAQKALPLVYGRCGANGGAKCCLYWVA
jgi:molybdopterin/thiamine biosynthesis adenylyltransferase